MGYFTCDLCFDTMKKNQIDKHCEFRCRNAWYFTCVDCGKTFEGFAYKEHNACMTEKEKYQGKFLEKQKQKKMDEKAAASLEVKEQPAEIEKIESVETSSTSNEDGSVDQNSTEKVVATKTSKKDKKQDEKQKGKSSKAMKKDTVDETEKDESKATPSKKHWSFFLKNGEEWQGWKKTIRRIIKENENSSIKKSKLRKQTLKVYKKAKNTEPLAKGEGSTLFEEKIKKGKFIVDSDSIVSLKK